MEETKNTIKDFILQTYLPGEDPDELTDSIPLITSKILDSIATLKLVDFIEEKYGIEFQAHEVNVENFNTISDIVNLVHTKLR
jgi:acyl carrier protein